MAFPPLNSSPTFEDRHHSASYSPHHPSHDPSHHTTDTLRCSRRSSRARRALGVGNGRDAPTGAALEAGRRRRADGDGRRADGRALTSAGEHDKVCGVIRVSSHITLRRGRALVVAYCRRCTAARSGRRWDIRWWRTRWRWAGRCRRRAGQSRLWTWWCSTWPGRRGSWPPSGWCCCVLFSSRSMGAA